MLIQKAIASGGNTVKPSKVDNVRTTAKGNARVTESSRRSKKMEFMYCIPDLEVFIDKTIKKCLLEYDLDANDTEAVLDDMEKAWPKSPPRSSEKQVLRDCNDNSQNGKSYRQDEIANQAQDDLLMGGVLNKRALKDGDSLVHFCNGKGSPELTEKIIPKKDEQPDVLSSGKKELERAVFEGDRSDSSSPDVVDGHSQARKHPKLKSLLQQRYFGGQESANSDTCQHGKKVEEKLDEAWGTNKQLSSNLELLASAADIHTGSARGSNDHRIEAIRQFQEESEKRFQVSSGRPPLSTSLHEPAVTSTEPSGWMPVLLKLMSSPSSSPMHELNNHDSDGINGHHNSNSLRMTGPEPGQRSSPNRPANNNPHLVSISRPQGTNSASFSNRDKPQQLFQAHQNGYHTHAPQETVLIRRDMSAGSNQGKSHQSSSSATHSSLSRDKSVDLVPSATQYNNFTIPSRSQLLQQNHLDHHQNYSDSFYEPLRYRGSRIANIIAEELEKDDDDDVVHEQQTYLSVSRTNHPGLKPSDINEPTRTRSFSLPGTYKRAQPYKPASYPSHDMLVHPPVNSNYKTVSRTEHVAGTQPRTVIHILPAHYSMTNTHSGTTILSSHLGQTISTASKATVPSSCFRIDEDQPQDLSTKPRRTEEDRHERQFPFSSNKGPHAPDNEPGMYFSAPIYQSTTKDGILHNESTSHCSHSDQECDYESRSHNGSAQIKPYEMERKGQVQGFDISPVDVKDGQILANNKRLNLTNISPETRDSKMSKRRKFE